LNNMWSHPQSPPETPKPDWCDQDESGGLDENGRYIGLDDDDRYQRDEREAFALSDTEY